jgi:hypothetical protein
MKSSTHSQPRNWIGRLSFTLWTCSLNTWIYEHCFCSDYKWRKSTYCGTMCPFAWPNIQNHQKVFESYSNLSLLLSGKLVFLLLNLVLGTKHRLSSSASSLPVAVQSIWALASISGFLINFSICQTSLDEWSARHNQMWISHKIYRFKRTFSF